MAIDWLVDKMGLHRSDSAVVWRERSFRYGELLDRLAFWRAEMESPLLNGCDVVCLEGDYSLNSCAALTAAIASNKIIVPFTHAAAPHRQEFFRIAEVQAAVTFRADDGWDICRTDISVVENPLTRRLIEAGRPGLVLFSSGSTGKPKAALHDFSRILEKFRIPRRRMTTLGFLLFDHIGGVNTLFYTLSNAGMLVMTDSRDPEVICELLERYRVELLPTTPTFLNMLLISESYRNRDLSALKLITYGTEMMPPSTLARLNTVFPNAQILQTYGLSEVGILRSKSKSSDSVWVKVGGEGFETRVVDGILWIRSQSAMVGYLNAPSPFTEDGWFITGDVVEVDGEYVRFMGRDSEIINVGGEKVYPAEVESVLLTMPGVEDAAVSGQRNPILGHIVTAKVKLRSEESEADFRARMRQFCRERLSKFKIPQKVVVVREKIHNERFKKIR